MSDTLTFYDLEFHFSSREVLSISVLDGRDKIDDHQRCPHCGAAPETRITVLHDDRETTHTILRDKLDAVQSTKRVEKKELTLDEIIAKDIRENVGL